MEQRTRFVRFALDFVAVVIAIFSVFCAGPLVAAENLARDSRLPDEILDRTYTYYRFEQVARHEAEALFGSATAAIYYPERGEVRMIADDNLVFAIERLMTTARKAGRAVEDPGAALGKRLRAKLHSTAAISLRSFLVPGPEKEGFGIEITDEKFFAKAPTFKSSDSMPAAEDPPTRRAFNTTAKTYYYIYDDFEQDSWAMWSRSDNTGGRYKWGVTSCDSYYGYYAADAARAGSQGAQLGCYSPYPASVEMYMSFEACESVPANWNAILEFQYATAIDQDGYDGLLVLFDNSQGQPRGWAFWGDTSGWFQLNFNLRQWPGIGDLGANYCNTFSLGFESDGTSNSGFGARVDEIYLYYGDSVPAYECGIIADPGSGSSPLTVSFRAATDIYSPDFYWRFGDGDTSEERDPVHVYQDAGSYNVTLSTYDSWGMICYSSTTINVSQGACSYNISPASATHSSSGGSGSFAVSTASGCSWSASSAAPWISITGGSSGSGSGTVSYTVDANPNQNQRSGTIQVAGRTFAITQSGAPTCEYSISPTSRSFGPEGGTASVSVSTNSGCSWNATPSTSWIELTGSTSGSGSGSVPYRVAENQSTASRSGSISIAGEALSITQEGASSQPPVGVGERYLAVGVIHSKGAEGSNWRSTLIACNPNEIPASVTLVYRGTKGEQATRSVTIPARGIRQWEDPVPDFFGISGNSAGVADIESDQPLEVSIRTYNYTPDGTFGQMLPGVSTSDSIVFGQTGRLSPVQRTEAFRTNIGVINTGDVACNVLVNFVSQDGDDIGTDVWFDVAPGEWKQIDDTLGAAGIDRVECAYALVDAFPPGCAAWAYGGVIDNDSNDPSALTLRTNE